MREFLEKASKAYYEGEPIISDAEYDFLAEKYGVNAVGYTSSNTIRHMFPMYSLQKCYDLNEAPLSITNDVVETPKLDGAAVSLLYVDGKLQLGLTRGDGVSGRDITDKVSLLVPNTIMIDGIVQVTGEVVAWKTIPNSRNYASGALNLKSIDEFKTREGLAFVAYGMESTVPFTCEYWTTLLRLLEDNQFRTVFSDAKTVSKLYPTDGTVYRINSLKEFERLGYTSSFPRGAFAFKTRQSGSITKLLNVDWQIGKSGVISPVAILEPVQVGDALVSRATLHNIEYINALGLEIGCGVEVIRSGEIIPRIVRRVDDL